MNNIINQKISLEEQMEYAEKVREIVRKKEENTGRKLACYITTFGCQQNEADSERLMGQAISMGYEKTDDPEKADLIIYNTCAVREHAELRALSRTGALKHLKEKNKNLIIGLWGCMVTQNHRMNDVKMSYPYVDFVAGTNMLPRLPEILHDVMTCDRRRYYVTEDVTTEITEGVPVLRENDIKAYVSIMYGCNNFCTYCVVPYVRGRERSRNKDCIIEEIKGLVKDGYKEITLLGQNVNSFGNKEYGFVDLLKDICEIEGDFIIRFMTSHPKDASDELIDFIAENKKMAKQFHLPMQSGSSEILRRMNRKYTAEKYIALAEKIKEKIPGVSLTTDIIVGFPGETEEDFLGTYEAVKKLRFDSIFSFIYSPRKGTPASEMETFATKEEISERMSRLIELQTEISAEINKGFVGKTVSALCDTKSRLENGFYGAKTTGNKTVFFDFDGDINYLYGKNIDIEITRSTAAQLYGEYLK